MKQRIEKNLQNLLPKELKFSVLAPENRRNSVWIGGSALVSLSTFSQMWITKEEYQEVGSQIVELKCF